MTNEASISAFDRWAAMGGRLLTVIGGLPPTVTKGPYLDLVAQIYETLASIHDNIIDVTIEVSVARSSEEALQSLRPIAQAGIRGVLKAQSMCDELGQMGRKMRDLLREQSDLAGQDKADWDELTYGLEKREDGTAELYANKFHELDQLARSALPLQFVQTRVEEISDLLVVQKAKFERLAKLAAAMRGRES